MAFPSLGWGACAENFIKAKDPEAYFKKSKVLLNKLVWTMPDIRYNFEGKGPKISITLQATQEYKPARRKVSVVFEAQRQFVGQIIESFFLHHLWASAPFQNTPQVTLTTLPPRTLNIVNKGIGSIVNTLFHYPNDNIFTQLPLKSLDLANLKKTLRFYQDRLNTKGSRQEDGIQVVYPLKEFKSTVTIGGSHWASINKDPRLLAYFYETLAPKLDPVNKNGKTIVGYNASVQTYDQILRNILNPTRTPPTTFQALAQLRYEQSVALLTLFQIMQREDAHFLPKEKIFNAYKETYDRLAGNDRLLFYFVTPSWENGVRGPLQLQAIEILPLHQLKYVPDIALDKLPVNKNYSWPIRHVSNLRLPKTSPILLPRDKSKLPRGLVRRTTPHLAVRQAKKLIANGNLAKSAKNALELKEAQEVVKQSHQRKKLRNHIYQAYQTAWNNGHEAARDDIQTIDTLLQYIIADSQKYSTAASNLTIHQNDPGHIFLSNFRDEVINSTDQMASYFYYFDFGVWPFKYQVNATADDDAQTTQL